MKNPSWQIWIDTGGTFTDCMALDPAGKLCRAKVLSNSALRGSVKKVIGKSEIQVVEKWEIEENFIKGFKFQLLDTEHEEIVVENYDPQVSVIKLAGNPTFKIPEGAAFEVLSFEEAPNLAARLVTKTLPDQNLPQIHMRLATTRGTNSLLEHKGAPIVLFITEGFKDLLVIGTQQRPDLFDLNINKPKPLYQKVVEVAERINFDGSVLKHLEPDRLTKEVNQLLNNGISVAAIALMHSYKNPVHEQKLAGFLLKSGFKTVSLSFSLAPFIKILPRAETAIVDAYLSPVIKDYLDRVKYPLKKGKLHVMTSAGGLVRAELFNPKDSLLSGPAGGVVGAAYAGKQAGYEKIIAFDMGGTSSDVARFDGDFEYLFEHEVGNAHLVAPALAIESVAAGGGSICSFDGTNLQVGPESAGASPGPACYRAGGPLTLTDVNLLLGRLDPSRFEIPIDIKKSQLEIDLIIKLIAEKSGEHVKQESILKGFIDIANERMADAIKRISLRMGYDPGEYALVAFGGAGAQHACGVADRLGIKTILIPGDAGLLSASGLGHAVLERFAERQILQNIDDSLDKIPLWIEKLSQQAVAAVMEEEINPGQVLIRRRILNLRFVGQDSTLSIEFDPEVGVKSLFEIRYRSIYGHWSDDRQIELESIRVVASTPGRTTDINRTKTEHFKIRSKNQTITYFDMDWQKTQVFERSALKPGAGLQGPALIFEQHSGTVLEAGWNCSVHRSGALICNKVKQFSTRSEQSLPEVVRIELFTNRFRTIAREMGEMLKRTAMSTNIKERLDFSCALLDPDGELVVNAPHIPVHLGALGLCVRKLIETIPLGPGDSVMTNHPAYGGSHLPDITVVTPVFTEVGQLLGFVANRAHHAEIGGIRPGSMPPMASNLAQEGVVIFPTYILKNGEPCWEQVLNIFKNYPYPSRCPAENIADLRAAVAANHKGLVSLQNLALKYGFDTVIHYQQALKGRAEQIVREVLSRIKDGIYQAVEYLDDGSPISVKITISGDRATFDFSGSADVHQGNMNATPAIVFSAVIYVIRLLVNEPLPLNEGLMRAIRVKIPVGILNPLFPEDSNIAPSIVGGNVETSQRLVDTILKALKLAACSQGTMNNVLFGNHKFSYYETVGGGCGAGPNYNGASAVHSHMTNTRITDPEIVEFRFPVRVDKFAIRKNSGGRGKYKGGDGTIREITFLEKMSLSILSQHRAVKPYGLEFGESGKSGEQQIIKTDGKVVKLGAIAGCEVEPGDRLLLKTPGGGGFGKQPKNLPG